MSRSVIAIDVEDVTKTYAGHIRALDRITFKVPAGAVFGILGPSGSGKSVLLKVLTTLSRPDSGRARIAGADVITQPAMVRRLIGYVPQRSGTDPAATGKENLVLHGQLCGLRGMSLHTRVAGLLEQFGLTHQANQLASAYPPGMLRRLDLAMGLVNRPSVLFLDEPFAGLDPESRSGIWREIETLAGGGVTVAMTAHYLAGVDTLTRRLILLHRGHVLAEGSPAQLKNELHGDAVHVELCVTPLAGKVEVTLGALDGITDVSVQGREVSARVGHGASAAPAVLSALENAGFRVASLTVSAPTLEDVYLRGVRRTRCGRARR
jgi:ABC-2 type transport system ATP-binding protein